MHHTHMLPHTISGSGSPTLIFLPFYGSSQHEWHLVLPHLTSNFRCITADPPGFGDAAHLDGYTVEEMTQHLLTLLASLAPEPCILIGHSMTGKVAMVAASRVPANLTALVLVAPSPLEPEPMAEPDRITTADAQQSPATARAFFVKGAKSPLPAEAIDQGIADVLRANPIAWRRWPQSGSREDWSTAVPTLDLPTLLVVGEHDPAIPLAFQRAHTLPHLSNGTLEVIPYIGHLIPYEAPTKLATLITHFISTHHV